MTACLPAIAAAPLHYRALQDLRSTALRLPRIDYDTLVYLSEEANADLNWWINHFTSHMCHPIQPPTASLTLQTDASTIGFNHRVGSLLPGNGPKNRRTVVRARSCSPQLVGAESSISSGTVFCQTGELPHTTTHGQQSFHILHQPKRRNSLAQTMPTGTGPVDVVRGLQHNFACGASTREIECHCGFRVQTHERQQRLATGHQDFLSSSTNSRSFLSGSICVLPVCMLNWRFSTVGRPTPKQLQ